MLAIVMQSCKGPQEVKRWIFVVFGIIAGFRRRCPDFPPEMSNLCVTLSSKDSIMEDTVV